MVLEQIDSKYFKAEEFACKCGCGFCCPSNRLVLMLDEARELARTPFIIDSGCRCHEHNINVGGEDDSAHLIGCAVDIRVTTSLHRYVVMESLYMVGFTRIGVANTFIHADIDRGKPQMMLWTYAAGKKRNK